MLGFLHSVCTIFAAEKQIIGMKKCFFLGLLGILTQFALSQVPLNDAAYISLLTSSPCEEEVFTVYGHAALRVHDPVQKLDYVFNYGIFDFEQPHFIYRFAKGETDYRLGVANYSDYVIEYQLRGSTITEQRLNLTPAERQCLWEALVENYRPENRVYRYNFFFDNCATRPAALIEKVVGQVDYHYPYTAQTFRSLINHCTRNHAWLTFGCDLALGSPTDSRATAHEMMFLPDYLREAFAKAEVIDEQGKRRPLVIETHVIEAGEPDEPEKDFWDLLSPMRLGWLTFALTYVITALGRYQKRAYKGFDILLFGLAGLAGCVLFFLAFFSVHPCTWPNYLLLWLHPFHLLGMILFCINSAQKAAYYYHFINFAALTLLFAGWVFLPQQLNSAFIPLAASLWLRSAGGIYRKKWTTE